MWLERDGQRLSSLDLIDGFTLLTSAAGQAWAEAARKIAPSLKLSLTAHVIDGASLAGSQALWSTSYGADESGAVLIRPDGHVGWRSKSVSVAPMQDLRRALTQILGKPL
jgi:hypothetical protein